MVREQNLSGQMDYLQEPKNLVTILDWGPLSGQVAPHFPSGSMCVWHQKGILGVGVNSYSLPFTQV